MPRQCAAALTAHREAQRTDRARAGERWDPLATQPAGLVFTSSTGRPIDPRSLNRMLTVLCRDAKARQVRVHDLRHTCASLLLAQGVDARTILETLGHSTITMTLDIYAHVMDSTLKAAAERMDDALGPDDGEDDQDDGPEGAPTML
ncbi:tyrosine-type recombinase/integrase [Streptomyces sp. SL13]|uniref:Tyrosine-type recombinase/integrase n=1 Tax=Streptantibioticus silvisoli TaxID=2705255 RepID=A0AA90H5Q4_9ACTN|nr:tyrosine-type recombinase/integrase [Streptantibioticus silvisoli]MDI5968602.1 tyrosine-type recombinase/integrase [Streptantibioticus silvisoli]